VFVSGAVLGAFGNRYYTAYNASKTRVKGKGERRRLSPEEFRAESIRFMQKRLKLTDDQVAKLGLIYDETRAQFEGLQKRVEPEQQAIANSQTERIRAMLDDEQKAEYERMRKEREEFNRGKGGKRGGFPGGGPGF
jgi:polyhydroxyalkanoate synthesis regulator phasin